MTSGEGATPEVTPVQATPNPMCAAILLRKRLAMEQEAATIAEAATGEPVRAPRPSDIPALACKACEDNVSFGYRDQLDAPNCIKVNSGSCEEIWIACHPDEYRADDGTLAVKSLFCGRCPANLELTQRPDGRIEGKVCDSTCAVDDAGERFRESGMETLNEALPSLEEMERQKTERAAAQKRYEEAQDRAEAAQQRAREEAHPEEAARDTVAAQNVLPQETQEEARNENDLGEDESWEEYDGDPNADLDVAAMQVSEEERATDEPQNVQQQEWQEDPYGIFLGPRHSFEKPYPVYLDARDKQTDPRWKWLASLEPVAIQVRNDAVWPGKQ